MPGGRDSLLISTPMGEPKRLAAGVGILDGFDLMFHGCPGRNARRAGVADSAHPALEYER